jgi:thiopeptide-type bacteriocin biosynthesis protein
MTKMLKPQRNFFLGSEWLYYKIYSGERISDQLLINTILPLMDKHIEAQYIDKWFFIRYGDPELHIRLRIHFSDFKHFTVVIKEIHDNLVQYVDQRVITKVSSDTYKRELERYGNHTIEASENLFCLNSTFVLKLLTKLTDDKMLWIYGIKFIDCFLDLWGFNLRQKEAFLEDLKIAFGKEHGIHKNLRKQLNLKYRNQQELIFNTLEKDLLVDKLLEDYKENAQPYITLIKEKKKKNELTIELTDLISSYLHMHCNRLFRSNQRTNEWVLYYMLYKYYNSKIGQLKSQNYRR